MAHDPADSRRSLQFDRARRELVLESVPAAQEVRKQWLERFAELLKAMFPDAEVAMHKPGLATRMFAADVPIGARDKIQALDLARELDDNWRAYVKGQGTVESCCYLDRLDGIWEWAVALEGYFVTGQVRLKNAAFVASSEGRPPFRKPYGGQGGFDRRRPHDGGNRPYGNRPPGDRPQGDRPYGDRGRHGGGRPGGRPWQGKPRHDDRGPRPGGDGPPPWKQRPYGGRPSRPRRTDED